MRLLTVLVAATLASCGVFQQPKVDSLGDGIAYTAAALETAAQEVAALCGAGIAGGECTGQISTETRDRLKRHLEEAYSSLELADAALANDNDIDAGNYLKRAESLLTMVKTVLEGMQ
jgi:hypothetical protein